MKSWRNMNKIPLYFGLLVLMLAFLACGWSANATPTIPSTPLMLNPSGETRLGPCTFGSDGIFVSGWYWLRDNIYAARGQWDCRGLPTGHSLPVSLTTLVTNGSDGGSGYSSPVRLTYSNPTSHLSQTIQVYLQNQLAEQSPANSRGAGYATTGYFVVPQEYIDANGGLSVQLERFRPNPFHVAVNAASLGFDQPRQAENFSQSKGVLIADWYWLRDPARQAYAEWTFHGLDPAAPATLVMDMLVTNQSNGGSGYSSPVGITLLNPSGNSQTTLRHVIAQNLAFSQETANSHGAGYQAYGSLALTPGLIDSQGNIIVRIARPDARYHLAVNQNSVGIIQPATGQSLATPPPLATPVSGGTGSDLASTGKYLFMQCWNSVAGSGKLPELAIDFPDYRFDPDAGSLSPFVPSRPIKLGAADVGFIGQGTSLSGAAGTGAVSSLDTIDRLPFSINVALFTGSVNLQDGPNFAGMKLVTLKVLAIADDGTVSIELDHQTLALAPGKSWAQNKEADVHEGKYTGHLVMTSTLTNYGWQDRVKINNPQ